MPDPSRLVKKTDYNTKISEIENTIPSISGLVITSALNAVEKKYLMLDYETDYDAKISEIKKKVTDHDHDKYIINRKYYITENFAARLAQANLVTKIDFDTKLISLNKKINSNKTKHLLVENELKKLQTFDSSYF